MVENENKILEDISYNYDYFSFKNISTQESYSFRIIDNPLFEN